MLFIYFWCGDGAKRCRQAFFSRSLASHNTPLSKRLQQSTSYKNILYIFLHFSPFGCHNLLLLNKRGLLFLSLGSRLLDYTNSIRTIGANANYLFLHSDAKCITFYY